MNALSGFLSALFLFTLTLLFHAELHAEYDRVSVENAIYGKQSDIRAIKVEIAKRELAIIRLTQHTAKEEAVDNTYDNVLSDLVAAKAELERLHSNNATKLIIKLLFKTAQSVHDSINLAKTASTELVNKGIVSTVATLTSDELTGFAEEEAQRAMGLHPDQLSSPRTVKIDVCSNLASQTVPELRNLQRAMNLSLDAIKGIILNENPELGEVSDDTAVLRKNEFVRARIDEVIAKIEALQAASALATNEEVPHIEPIQEEIVDLQRDLRDAKDELGTYEQQLRTLEEADQLAAAVAQHEVYEALPPLVLDTPVDPEPAEDYEERVDAAYVAEAWEEWGLNGDPLLQQVYALKSDIENAWSNLMTTHQTIVEPANPGAFIEKTLEKGPNTADALISLPNLAEASESNEEHLALVNQLLNELPGLLTSTDDLQSDFVLLQQTRVQLQEVHDQVSGHISIDLGTSGDPPVGVTHEDVIEYSSQYTDYLSFLPSAIGAGTEQTDELVAAYAASLSASTELFNKFVAELNETTSPMQRMITAATNYQGLLESNPILAPPPDISLGYDSPGRTVYGYWSTSPILGQYHIGFQRVLDRQFEAFQYVEILAYLLQNPDTVGAYALKEDYLSLVAASNGYCQEYNEAWTELEGGYNYLAPFSNNGSLVLVDEFNAVTNPPGENAAPPAPGDVNARFSLLDAMHTVDFVTNLDGSVWTAGEGDISANNYGLSQLEALPFIEFDESERTLTVHRILEIRRDIATNLSTWLGLPGDEFNSLFTGMQDELLIFANNTEIELAKDFPDYFGGFSSSLVTAVADSAVVAQSELLAAHLAYQAANPAPEITDHTGYTSVSVPQGGTATVTLSVTATGNHLSYQWYVSKGSYGTGGYDAIVNGTSASLVYQIGEERDFLCKVSNYSGQALTDVIHVGVLVTLPELQWHGTTSKSGVVGTPFSWSLSTTPASESTMMFPFDEGVDIDFETGLISPLGLTFNMEQGTITGTPLVAGVYQFAVDAFTDGYEMLFQEITITITETAPPNAVYDAWIEGSLTPEQLADPALSELLACPAGDNIPNLVKFALGLNPSISCTSEDVMQISDPVAGEIQLFFILDENARAAGATVTLMQAPSVGGPWTPVPDELIFEGAFGDQTAVGAAIELDDQEGEAFYRLEVSL